MHDTCNQRSQQASGRRWVFEVKMPDPVRIELISKMADVEYRLAFAVSERLQLGSLVGAFAEAKEGLVKAAA